MLTNLFLIFTLKKKIGDNNLPENQVNKRNWFWISFPLLRVLEEHQGTWSWKFIICPGDNDLYKIFLLLLGDQFFFRTKEDVTQLEIFEIIIKNDTCGLNFKLDLRMRWLVKEIYLFLNCNQQGVLDLASWEIFLGSTFYWE